MTTTTPMNGHAAPLFDADEVRRALALLLPAGQVTELRALDATTANDRWPRTLSGYFNDHEKLIDALGSIKNAMGVYITPNPVDARLIARVCNRIRKAEKNDATSDKDITARKWLLIDCDADRPAGISATDAEHDAAIAMAKKIADALRFNYGWPDSILGDSGNGGHLLYSIDLPADDGGLVEKCLLALSEQFTDDIVKVDTSVYNPARVWKLYGARAGKGDSISDRPHRIARIISAPATLQVVSRELLRSLADEVAQLTPAKLPNAAQSNGFSIDSFIRRHGFELSGPDAYQGGRKWTFRQSPLCDHHGDGPFLIQFSNGALSAGCHHDSCSWSWHDLRAKYEPKRQGMSDWRPAEERGELTATPIIKLPFAKLRLAYPKLKPPVVHGLFREGETANIIADPKRGKSWLGYGMLFAIITGEPWLGRFNTAPGRALLIDNELHPENLAFRIPVVANALGLFPEQYENQLEVWSLRGRLQSLRDLADDLAAVEYGEFSAIVLDAKYRFARAGVSENDNAEQAMFYNEVDQIAERTGAAVVMIHHSSKGSQSDKRVTDVGAGAGAQSRAADCHLVLREHEDEGVVVLAAAVRSFPPVEPLAIRWNFPLWMPDSGIDPVRLKGRQTAAEQRQAGRDKEGVDKIVKALLGSPATARQLRPQTGLSRERQQRLLDLMESEGHLSVTKTTLRGNPCNEYHLTQST